MRRLFFSSLAICRSSSRRLKGPQRASTVVMVRKVTARAFEEWIAEDANERAVLEAVVAAYPEAIARDSISTETEYARSSRDTYLQRLAARRLVEPVGRGSVRAAKELFDA